MIFCSYKINCYIVQGERERSLSFLSWIQHALLHQFFYNYNSKIDNRALSDTLGMTLRTVQRLIKKSFEILNTAKAVIKLYETNTRKPQNEQNHRKYPTHRAIDHRCPFLPYSNDGKRHERIWGKKSSVQYRLSASTCLQRVHGVCRDESLRHDRQGNVAFEFSGLKPSTGHFWIVYMSFMEGIFPNCLKIGHVTQFSNLVKKFTLNYRPITTLPVLSNFFWKISPQENDVLHK